MQDINKVDVPGEKKLVDHRPSSSEDSCWICFEGAEASPFPLLKPCSCPRHAHQSCLARWQLQSAGKSEEQACRFCGEILPNWRKAYASMPMADPVMTISHNGGLQFLTVRHGEEGRAKFREEVRKVFGLQDDEDILLTFGCKVPGTGEEINLEGWEAFDAAVHCAAICAGQRMASVLNHASGPQDTVTAAQQRVDVQHGAFLQLQTQSQAGWTPSVRERLMTTMRRWKRTWKALHSFGTVAPSQVGQGLHSDVRHGRSRGGQQYAASRDELYNLM